MMTEEIPHFTHCPRCSAPLYAPAPKVQVENFRRWQREHPVFYHWTDGQLTRLVERLSENPSDVLMLPAHAHSIHIRRSDGSVYEHFRVK